MAEPQVPRVYVKAGHVQPIWAGHPWVFAQAVAREEGNPRTGQEVEVVDPRGHVLGRGHFEQESAIRVRLFTRGQERFDASLLAARLDAAEQRRTMLALPSEETTGYRLINAEGDGLPGMVVDCFGGDYVVQVTTSAARLHGDTLARELRRRTPGSRVFPARGGETARLAGIFDDPAGVALRFRERGLSFSIPTNLGQKTGFYFDLRDLRARVETLARGRRVLDCYGYVGAVALSAARGGATQVACVDSSEAAVEIAAECAEANGLQGRITFIHGDAFEFLKGAHQAFDLVVCDPPKLAPTRRARDGAARYMRRLAATAAAVTAPGGLLVLCSCSANLRLEDLQRALALGSADATRESTVLERYSQAADHPVTAGYPEGLYLTALLAQVKRRDG